MTSFISYYLSSLYLDVTKNIFLTIQVLFIPGLFLIHIFGHRFGISVSSLSLEVESKHKQTNLDDVSPNNSIDIPHLDANNLYDINELDESEYCSEESMRRISMEIQVCLSSLVSLTPYSVQYRRTPGFSDELSLF